MTTTTPKALIDPKVRLQLLTGIKNTLYENSDKRLKISLSELIRDNSSESGNDQRWMTYLGELYASAPAKEAEKITGPINLVHVTMRERMKAYLAAVQKTDQEKSLVLGYVRKIMAQSSHAEDLYKFLPLALHGSLSKLDRCFIAGPGKFSDKDVNQFKEDNAKYARMLTARLAYNLLDVVEA